MIPVIRVYECVRMIFGGNQGHATGMTQSCPYPTATMRRSGFAAVHHASGPVDPLETGSDTF